MATTSRRATTMLGMTLLCACTSTSDDDIADASSGTDGQGSDGSSSAAATSQATTADGSAEGTITTTAADSTASGTTATDGTDGSTGDDTGGGQVSQGCGMPATPGATERMIEVAGVMRTFTVAIPDAYDPMVPHPVAFGFHGLGGTGSGYYIPGGLDPAPIVIGPNAEPAGGAWNTQGDLDFVDAILDTVSAELCLDLSRVFASGYSNGGFMADAVACQRADVFRGVAVMEGGSAGGFDCGQTAMWIMHNQDDMTVPLSYGTTLLDQWLAANGCSETTQPIAPDPCVVYDGCSSGNPVVWCSPATGGHNPNYDAAAAVPAWWNSL